MKQRPESGSARSASPRVAASSPSISSVRSDSGMSKAIATWKMRSISDGFFSKTDPSFPSSAPSRTTKLSSTAPPSSVGTGWLGRRGSSRAVARWSSRSVSLRISLACA